MSTFKYMSFRSSLIPTLGEIDDVGVLLGTVAEAAIVQELKYDKGEEVALRRCWDQGRIAGATQTVVNNQNLVLIGRSCQLRL